MPPSSALKGATATSTNKPASDHALVVNTTKNGEDSKSAPGVNVSARYLHAHIAAKQLVTAL